MTLSKKQDKLLKYLLELSAAQTIAGITAKARSYKVDPVFNSLMVKENLLIKDRDNKRIYHWHTIKPNIHMVNKLISMYENRPSPESKAPLTNLGVSDESLFCGEINQQNDFDIARIETISGSIHDISIRLMKVSSNVEDIRAYASNKHKEAMKCIGDISTITEGLIDFHAKLDKDARQMSSFTAQLDSRIKRMEINVNVLTSRVDRAIEYINRPWWKRFLGIKW